MSTMTLTTTAPASRGRRAARAQLPWGSPLVYFVALVVIALMLGPVIYIIIGGFRSNSAITVDPAGFPDPWNFENYASVITSGQFWTQVGNSTIAALATTVGAVALGLMASYVIARYSFRGRGVLYALFAAGLMFPITVAITPLYIVVRTLGLMNSLPGVILPQIAFALPTTVIILVPFLRAIPDEIQEAAYIDGCGRLGFFFRMVLRLAVPGVITVGILAFIGSWNAYLLPLFILNNEATFTLPLGVQAFSSQYSVDTARVLAFTSLSMLPALIFFSLFERRIVGGLTGAVKG
jgi:raffinose/stachyose/melibiose transport system permease protein